MGQKFTANLQKTGGHRMLNKFGAMLLVNQRGYYSRFYKTLRTILVENSYQAQRESSTIDSTIPQHGVVHVRPRLVKNVAGRQLRRVGLGK